jgi:hypothetical protein
MFSNAFTHVLECLISLIFVRLSLACSYIITLGKRDERSEKQKRVRAKQMDDSDPTSSYRAVEVFDKLPTQPEHKVKTLAVIPDLCLQRFADRETMGVRDILQVEEDKQTKGKVFKKVFFSFRQKHLFRKIF